MKSKLTIDEKIELYLANKLSHKDKVEFEHLIANDKATREKLELMQHITIAFERLGEAGAYEELQRMDEKELNDIIADVEKKYRSNKSTKLSVWWLSGVAAAIILVFIGFQPKYSSKDIYSQHHTIPAFEQQPPSRGGSAMNAEQEKELASAISFYKTDDFSKASIAFGQAGKNMKLEELPDYMIFYWAISLTETEQLALAIQKLEYLSKLDNSEFQEDAQWHLALVFLKEGKKSEAKKQLSDITKTASIYSEKAKELLKKLNKKRWF